MNKVQIAILIFSGVAGLVALAFFGGFIGGGSNEGPGSIKGMVTIWGLESETAFRDFFNKVKKDNNIDISYSRKNEASFTSDLTKAIARGEGPDLVLQGAEWISENRDILYPAPQSVILPRDFQNVFVDSASQAFLENDKIWAMPLWIDSLVLFWNKDIFNDKLISLPPKDWDEVRTFSNQIHEIGDGGKVGKAGIALGRARNIPLFKEIIALLLLQLGSDLEDKAGKFDFGQLTRSSTKDSAGVEALRFYTDFSKPEAREYTWNLNLPEPRDFFASGKLAMMLDFASYTPDLRAKNPHLSFDISPAPQLEKSESRIYFASVGGAAVPLASKNKLGAWAIAKALANKENSKIFIQLKTVAPARKDLLADKDFLKNELGPFLREITLNAKRVRDSRPKDNSDAIRQMIESVADGRLSATKAISDASTLLNSKRQ